MERARVRSGMLAATLEVYFVSRGHSVVVYVAGLGAYPERLGDKKRHIMCQLLRLLGCCMLRIGHLELGLKWGWPLLPSLHGASMLELHSVKRRRRRKADV